MKTDIKILQGHQVGGCITIISTKTNRIVIDFGETLPGTESAGNINFDWEKEKIDAVFLLTITVTTLDESKKSRLIFLFTWEKPAMILC